MAFEITRIGDICKKVCSGGTPTSSNPDYYDGGIPWLNTNEVNFCNIYSTNKTISEEGLNHSAAKYIPVNSIIVAMYGVTAGKCAVAKIPLTTNQACCNLVIDEEKAHYQYVYHFLKLQSDNLNKLANGGAQQNLNSIIIKKFKIALPSLNIQQRIASILSAYDNLIENNNKRIRLLEQMAENLYKEWFVRFRFPGHEKAEFENGLPKGWKYKRADEVILFNPTLKVGKQTGYAIIPMEALSTSSMVLDSDCFEIKETISGRRSQNGDTLFAKITPCLENGKIGFVMGLPEGEVFGGSTEFIVLRSKTLSPYYVYCTARSYHFRQTAILSMNGADGRQRVDEDKLKSYKVVQPAKEDLEKFDRIVSPYFKQILHLTQENRSLSRQRDLLLPRLMSGKLEVKV